MVNSGTLIKSAAILLLYFFAERDSWGRAVRSQIENQDTSAFTVFKSQLDSNFREVTGYALEDFLAKLGRSGAEASKRTAVKPEEGSKNADKLQSFAEVCQENYYVSFSEILHFTEKEIITHLIHEK